MDRLRKTAASHSEMHGGGERGKIKGWIKASCLFPCSVLYCFFSSVSGWLEIKGWMLNIWQWYTCLLVNRTAPTYTNSLTPKSPLTCTMSLWSSGQRAPFSLGETGGIVILNVTLSETHSSPSDSQLQLKVTGPVFVQVMSRKTNSVTVTAFLCHVPTSCISTVT